MRDINFFHFSKKNEKKFRICHSFHGTEKKSEARSTAQERTLSTPVLTVEVGMRDVEGGEGEMV